MNIDGAIAPRVGWVQRSKRFDADNAAAFGGDDRLIMNVERLVADRGLELAQEEPPLGMLFLDLRHEAPHRAAAAALGGAQRQRRAAIQFVAGGAVFRRLRDADADADLPHLIHEDRRGERGRDPVGKLGRGLRVFAADDDGEFVVLETPEQRAVRQPGLETLGDADQHRVAAGPAQRVVDVVEAVDVDQREDDDRARGAPPSHRRAVRA